MIADAVTKALRQIDDLELIEDPSRRKVYESDGLTAFAQMPPLVALPNSLQALQAVLRVCHTHHVPMVARGAGTGLSGGATPLANGLLIGLAKFNRILEIDPIKMTARVEPGVTNLAISKAVASTGLFYAPDPSSQIACTIGGNVAENSGGVHCLKYGLTLHNVCALKVMLADGEVLSLGGTGLWEDGLDLLALLHGSEGLLGLVIEVTVALRPMPEAVTVLMAGFADTASAAHAVSAVIQAGVLPAGLEMMDRLAIQAAEDFVHAGYPLEAQALLLCELDGGADEIDALSCKVQAVLQAAGAQSLVEASDAEARARLWLGRKAAFPAVGRIAPDYYCMDGTIPRRHLAAVLGAIAERSEHYRLPVANVFHAGDGNLHPLILYDANDTDQFQRAEAFGADVLEICLQFGGTITGEHGVGLEKIDQMCSQFSAVELTVFHAVKSAFDPAGLLNPGKAIPTLNRCAEFGAMHVHQGAEKHPELPRF
ncbi:MAG: glycolate oxidase [Candidatus Azotimanducaceae bacterium]|jgi:glycolate oxidase|tara:strand:- start:941 stop:2392 length:1452 start_codon:yes stop_codon:yes gene_type:complete